MKHVVCVHCDTINRIPSERPAAAAKCGRCHAPLFEGLPVPMNAERFRRHLQCSDIPLLVDFWAPWCGPCRSMAPAFERAAAALEPNVRLVKVDTEEEPALAASYGIRSIPTLALFVGGREVARTAGAMDQRAIMAWTQQNIGGS